MKTLLCGATAAGIAILGTPASAQTKIVLHDIGGVAGSPAEAGFRIAASYWESVLTNNVTIDFDVGFSALGPGVLGGTSTSLYTYVPIQDYYDALVANGVSALDAQAIAHLEPLSANGSVAPIVPQYRNQANHTGVNATGSRVAPDGEAISSTIAVASSTWQALTGDVSGTDANIQFSSTFAFDFDPSDGITAGQYDFIGVAIHEMGHALGFLSGADDFDYSVGGGFPVDEYWWGYASDLFRYSADGQLNWNFDTPSYFSIDGGASAFLGNSYYSTGENNGDGWQASHWRAPGGCANFVGIMNPYICDGLVDSITAQDLGFFDAIGWNVNVDVLANPNYNFTTAQVYAAAVPEASSWMMMILGFGALGGAMRYRTRRSTVSYA
jgi:hypothetical protein